MIITLLLIKASTKYCVPLLLMLLRSKFNLVNVYNVS